MFFIYKKRLYIKDINIHISIRLKIRSHLKVYSSSLLSLLLYLLSHHLYINIRDLYIS